jgi:hypothetical protein
MHKRVKFDFEIRFTNGGGIQGQDFRLDMEGDDISEDELAEYIVKDMRLLMVGDVRILNKEIIAEKHKRQPEENQSKSQFVYYLQPTRLGMLTEEPTSEEAEDESAVRRIMENDPAVAGGVMRANLYPYKVALMRR